MDKYPEKIVDVNEEAKENEKEQSQNFVEEVRRVQAKVVNCHRLNIRERPTMSSRAITTVAVGTMLEIIDKKNPGNFYKIVLQNGIEGFCVKDFVTIIS